MGMGKNDYSRNQMKPRVREAHPIWRGVGFALIILTPLMAWAIQELVMQALKASAGFRIPKELMLVKSNPELIFRLLIGFVIVVILYVLYMLIYFLIYRAVGPSRYGPYDVPPPSYKGKPYRR